MRKFGSKLTSKKGQGMIEYVIIMALLVVAAIVVLSKLGNVMKNKFNDVAEELDDQDAGNNNNP